MGKRKATERTKNNFKNAEQLPNEGVNM